MNKIQNIENKILIILIVLAGIIIFSLGFIWSSGKNKSNSNIKTELSAEKEISEEKIESIAIDREDTESASSSIGNKVEEKDKNVADELDNKDKVNENKVSKTEKENIEKKDNKVEQESNIKETNNNIEKEPKFMMPVDGEIIKGFANDNLVFSETLQEWMVHKAIDIKADTRDVVKASADGKVKSIKNDPRYGLTVIIEHSAGFETVYSNLLTAEFVVEGENVKQGQTIGTVGNSAIFEVADPSHLHFEILKNSESVDPSIYIK